jgi:Phage integrase family
MPAPRTDNRPDGLRLNPDVIEDWLANGRADPGTLDVFTTERGGLVLESTLLRRLRLYCQELELPDGLDLHSFRRSYATHLLEDGWDPRFVQYQMGHEHAATTGIYQFVSDDFRQQHPACGAGPYRRRSARAREGGHRMRRTGAEDRAGAVAGTADVAAAVD